MADCEDVPTSGFRTSSWSPSGIATLHATGRDTRSVLEAGLRAVLALAVAPAPTSVDTGRSAPIRGEGDDLGNLLADLIQDLLGQIEFFGGSLHDVALDGVLRREDGSYIGWGYASGTLEPMPPIAVPRLLDTHIVSEGATQDVVLHATLHRP